MTVIKFAVVGMIAGLLFGAPEIGMLIGAFAAVVYGWWLDRSDGVKWF